MKNLRSNYPASVIAVMGIAILTSAGLPSFAAPAYNCYVVPIPVGDNVGISSINARGIAVGGIAGPTSVEAFAFSPSLGLKILNSPVETEESAVGINDSGQILVTGGDNYVYDLRSGKRTDLAFHDLPNDDIIGTSINDEGDVAGDLFPSTNNFPFIFPFIDDRSFASHGLSDNVEVTKVNDRRVIVGNAFDVNGNGQPYIWSADHGLTLLPIISAPFSQTFGLNNFNHVVGDATISDGSVTGFEWDPTGGLTILPDLSDIAEADTDAMAVNDHGDIVGDSGQDNGAAVIWSNGTITDLNTLVPTNLTFRLRIATAISNRGSIGGLGLATGTNAEVGFILVPADSSTPD